MSPDQFQPIRPEEIAELKQHMMPTIVIETVNALLAKKAAQGNYIVLTQKEIVRELVKKGFKKETIFEEHYLDFEAIYEGVGWKVTYSGPAYNEDFEATFTFKAK